MNISNEVLAERIQGFTRETVAESQQLRRDISNMLDQIGRFEDRLIRASELQLAHEAKPGHEISLLKIATLEKDSEAAKREIANLGKILNLESDVSKLKSEMNEVKTAQISEESFRAGQKSALSTGEKLVLLIIAAGPFILAGIRALSS